MSQLVMQARSNYFRVRDEQAFRAAIATLNGEVGVWESAPDDFKDGELRFALYGDDSEHGGWPDLIYPEDSEPVEVDVQELVAEHLLPGDVAIFIELASDRLRWLHGVATAINSAGETRTVALSDIMQLAQELGSMVTAPEH